jgi:hypothetical protein
MRPPRQDEPIWMVAHSRELLDPSRYLGELDDLPTSELQPGAWCDVVLADSEGEMRWTLVLVDCTSAVSIFAERRSERFRSNACRKAAGRHLQADPEGGGGRPTLSGFHRARAGGRD